MTDHEDSLNEGAQPGDHIEIDFGEADQQLRDSIEQERMERIERAALRNIERTPRASLAGALARAKAVFEPIPRNKTVRVTSKRTGATYEFKYATLDAILAAITPALSQNGLSLLQDIEEAREDGDTVLRVTTTILHESGEMVSLAPVRVMLPGGETNAQDMGSALTYAQRYSIRLALVIGTDDDDDGNAASGNTAQTVREATPKQRAPRSSDAVSDAITRAIMACATLDELQDYWLTLSSADRIAHASTKDLRKQQLS